MRIIYLDVLIITNFIVSLFLLMIVKKITHSSAAKAKMVIAAFVIGLASLTIIIDNTSFLLSLLLFLVKLIIAVIGVLICFKITSVNRLIRYLILYVVANTVFTGVCTIIWNLSGGKVISVNNGSVYFDVSMFELIIFTIISYLLISVFEYIRNLYCDKNSAYVASFTIDGKEFSLNGISDTGNKLTDIFYAKPVLICYSSKIWNELELDSEENIIKLRLHPLTLQTVSGSKVIFTTKPVSVNISIGGTNKSCLVCVGFLPSENMSERCLFNPKILF